MGKVTQVMTMLKVDAISTYYGQFQALKEVSLTVDDGELVVIFGPNGHGKTTLLKTICGLLRPSSGRVEFGGKEIHKAQTHKMVEMGIVYIPEGKHLFPEMTVLDNLKLGAYNVNARRRQKEMLRYVFDLFPQLDRLKHRVACTLSGGEAQMLTIGRGLMSCPRFLAIDEPSLGLGPAVLRDVLNKITEINRAGVSVLLVEQNVAQVLRAGIGKRIYLIEDGHIVFEGDQRAILSSDYVKEVFLGQRGLS